MEHAHEIGQGHGGRISPRSLVFAAFAAALIAPAAQAAGWRNHAQPYTFLFGNHIDPHQQTMLKKKGELSGFFYVKFTGDVTADGLRVARHVDCTQQAGCTAGWKLSGRAASAKFLYHVMPDHPVWHLDRGAIPQPGSYTHFHWLDEPHPGPGEQRNGYLLELQAIDSFCFVHDDAPAAAGTCSEIGGLAVSPGIDTATHTNIVTSEPPAGN